MSTQTFDPFDPAVIEEPYPHYRRLRDAAPCFYCAERDIYVLSRYDDVVRASRDTKIFSSTQGVGYERRPVPMMIAYDPPEHSRLRRIVAGRFTPKQVARWTQRIEDLVSELLDAAIGAGPIDLVEKIALPLPVQVIAEMMDVPAERHADFKRWSGHTVTALAGAVDLTPEQRAAVEASIVEFAMYLQGVIAERRERARAGAEDLISLLLQANEDGERLADHELVSFCVLLLVAGHETTTNLISNATLQLMSDPEPWRTVCRDPGLIPSLVEESLRFDAPIQGFFRNTLAETEVAGVRIPADAKVMLLYGSANRDERHFPEPDRYQVERNPTDHLAFGSGPHTCLGAHVARLEARILAEHVVRKVARMRPEGPAIRTRNPLLRGLAALPVRIEGR